MFLQQRNLSMPGTGEAFQQKQPQSSRQETKTISQEKQSAENISVVSNYLKPSRSHVDDSRFCY